MMKNKQQVIIAPCPDCEHKVRLGQHPARGEKFTCPNCWAYLELISIDPPELQWDVAIEDAWEDEPQVESGEY
jgi:transcription initiation factor IIE alpha subunit